MKTKRIFESQTETNEKQSTSNFDVHRYFNQFTICSNILVMKNIINELPPSNMLNSCIQVYGITEVFYHNPFSIEYKSKMYIDEMTKLDLDSIVFRYISKTK